MRSLSVLAFALALGACDIVRAPNADGTLVNTVARADANRLAREGERVAFEVPDTADIPDGPVGKSIRRGLALVTATADSYPRGIKAQMRCTSCHLDAGTRPNAFPFVGVAARFPQYRSRNGSMVSLEERIRGCFQRSLNGRAPAPGSQDLVDMVAYMTWLSQGTPVGRETEGQGSAPLEVTTGDAKSGRTTFVAQCARCHGANGEGGPSTSPGLPHAPPLWGAKSFNIGAGMARVGIMSSFIRHAMPYDQPGTLTEQQAVDVATYIGTQLRPDFPGKEQDWPNGDAPADAAYRTRAQRPAGSRR